MQTLYEKRLSRHGQQVTLKTDDILQGHFGCYQVKELKGEGAYGLVARCVDLLTNKDVALKISKLNRSRTLRHEAVLLRRLRYLSQDKNVVEFITSFQYQGQYCLVMEHLDQSLFSFMKKSAFRPLHVSDIRYITEQLLVTLNELVKCKLIHADLKPDNIMLVDQRLQPFKIKLIDFGLCTTVNSLIPGRVIQPIGYRAPEVSLGTKLDEAVDMWGLGCVLAFLYMGQNLFPAHSEYEMMRIITKIQGLPDKQQLQEGIFTGFYFNNVCGQYQLCSPEEYTAKTGKVVRPCRTWSGTFTSLESMKEYHPEPVLKREKKETVQFFDFLNKVLVVNPANRLTQENALRHPFITQNWPSTPKENTDTTLRKRFLIRKLNAMRKNKGVFNSSSSELESNLPNTSVSTGRVTTCRTTVPQQRRRKKKVCENAHPSVVGRPDLSSSSSEDDEESSSTITRILTQNIKNVPPREWGKMGGKQSRAGQTYAFRATDLDD